MTRLEPIFDIPGIVECPLKTCMKRFKVEHLDEWLPTHDAPDGRRCPYEGPGLLIQ